MLRDTSAASTSNRSTSAARAAGANDKAPSRSAVCTIWRRRIATVMRCSIIGNLGKNSTGRCGAGVVALGGKCTVRRKGDLDQGPGLRRAFDPELRVIGLDQRLSHRQPELGSAR